MAYCCGQRQPHLIGSVHSLPGGGVGSISLRVLPGFSNGLHGSISLGTRSVFDLSSASNGSVVAEISSVDTSEFGACFVDPASFSYLYQRFYREVFRRPVEFPVQYRRRFLFLVARASAPGRTFHPNQRDLCDTITDLSPGHFEVPFRVLRNFGADTYLPHYVEFWGACGGFRAN